MPLPAVIAVVSQSGFNDAAIAGVPQREWLCVAAAAVAAVAAAAAILTSYSSGNARNIITTKLVYMTSFICHPMPCAKQACCCKQ